MPPGPNFLGHRLHSLSHRTSIIRSNRSDAGWTKCQVGPKKWIHGIDCQYFQKNVSWIEENWQGKLNLFDCNLIHEWMGNHFARQGSWGLHNCAQQATFLKSRPYFEYKLAPRRGPAGPWLITGGIPPPGLLFFCCNGWRWDTLLRVCLMHWLYHCNSFGWKVPPGGDMVANGDLCVASIQIWTEHPICINIM